LGHCTVQAIVNDTCKIIRDNLLAEMMPNPTEDMWKSIANDYNTIWNFPNCVGALDGKHVNIQAPPNSCTIITRRRSQSS